MSDSEALEKKQSRRLLAVLIVTSAFCGIKLFGASMAKSTVLHADALHLVLDIGALSMALLAMRIASRPPTERYPFGLRRIEPLAALANGLLVLVASGYIVQEGLESMRGGNEPVPAIMMGVSVVALLINGASAYLLHGAMGHGVGSPAHAHHAHGPVETSDPPARCAHGPHDHAADHDHDHAHDRAAAPVSAAPHAHTHHGHADHSLNLRGALLHLVGDTLGALAAFATAVAIWLGAPRIVDPLASFLVAAILFVAAMRLLRDALRVLLEATPDHLALADVRRTAEGAADDVEVIDAHAWTVGAGQHALGLRVRTSTSTAAQIEGAIREKHRVSLVWVHVVSSQAP